MRAAVRAGATARRVGAAALALALLARFKGPLARALLQLVFRARLALQRAGMVRRGGAARLFSAARAPRDAPREAPQQLAPPSDEVLALRWVFELLPGAGKRDRPSDVVRILGLVYELAWYSHWVPHSAHVKPAQLECGLPVRWVRAPEARSDAVVLFAHGGGYVSGHAHAYVGALEQVSRRADCRVLAVDYPLAPEASVREMRDALLRAYAHLLECGVRPEQVAVMGDSAGGGLALGLLQDIVAAGKPVPAAGVLLSPLCDMSLEAASMTPESALDPFFKKQRFFTLTRELVMARTEHPPEHPDNSSLNGSFEGLPPLFVCVGEDERLRDDSLEAARRAEAAGVDVTLERHPYGMHNYPFLYSFGVPEFVESLDRLSGFVRDKTAAP